MKTLMTFALLAFTATSVFADEDEEKDNKPVKIQVGEETATDTQKK